MPLLYLLSDTNLLCYLEPLNNALLRITASSWFINPSSFNLKQLRLRSQPSYATYYFESYMSSVSFSLIQLCQWTFTIDVLIYEKINNWKYDQVKQWLFSLMPLFWVKPADIFSKLEWRQYCILSAFKIHDWMHASFKEMCTAEIFTLSSESYAPINVYSL